MGHGFIENGGFVREKMGSSWWTMANLEIGRIIGITIYILDK